jgi:hypothetical protein
VLTFYLAREAGKTEESRRIIPVSRRLIELGLNEYIDTLPKVFFGGATLNHKNGLARGVV